MSILAASPSRPPDKMLRNIIYMPADVYNWFLLHAASRPLSNPKLCRPSILFTQWLSLPSLDHRTLLLWAVGRVSHGCHCRLELGCGGGSSSG